MRLITSLCLLLLAPLALAQSLTTDRAREFVNSLDEVQTYTESLDPAISESAFEEQMMPGAGEAFAPYTRAMTYMKDNHPDIHREIASMVDGYGFSSPEAWADIGDRVALAFMATQMNEADMAQIDNITPEMMEQMPEQMRPQMEMMLAMVEAVRNTPQSDIEAVRPLSGQLMEYMNMGPPQ